MKSFLIVAGAFMAVAGSALAMSFPTCVAGTYTSYEALSGGCVINNLLFSNFSDMKASSGNAVTLAASSITVTPDFVSLDEGLGFTAAWSVTSPGSMDSLLSFTVQTVDGSKTLNDIDLSFNGAATGSGTTATTETYCVGSTIGTAHCPTPIKTIAVSSPSGVSGPVTQFYAPTNALSVSKDIILAAGTSGTASISLVSNTYSQTGVVPEPMSFVYLGTGLIAIGLLRRRTAR